MSIINQSDRELLFCNSYREFLAMELRNRKAKKELYSLRAMARDLGVPASRLSNIVNGRTNFTESSLGKVAESLQKPEPIRAFFLALGLWELRAPGDFNSPHFQEARSIRIRHLHTPVELPHRAVGGWSLANMALLLLLRLEKEVLADANLCRRLNVSPEDLENMLGELERLKLIQRTQAGPKATVRFIELGGQGTRYEIQGIHKKGIQRALWCMDNLPLEKRFFYSSFFTMDPAKAELMAEKLRECALSIGLEQLPAQPDHEVYTVGTYLVPLTLKEDDL